MEGDDDVPAGWISKVSSKTGRPYYYNTKTRKSQWEKPTEPGESRARLCVSGALVLVLTTNTTAGGGSRA